MDRKRRFSPDRAARQSALGVKERELVERLQRQAPLLLAVSGGLDSRFLTHLALSINVDAAAVHFVGGHVAAHDTEEALAWLQSRGVPCETIEVDVLADRHVGFNRKDRCYHCKRLLFEKALQLGSRRGRTVMDGSNASDHSEYRPGLKALQELGVVSPLADSGFTKEDIKQSAKRSGLDRPDQPSRPCLLTRFAYDMHVRSETMRRVADAERRIASLGFQQFRLRILSDDENSSVSSELHIAASETSLVDEKRKSLAEILKQYDFSPTILTMPSISGHFDV